ncbi:chromosome partitioning protein ParA [Vibrio vulnificus]|uniref:chromosome partitioning protein ParA n=1 Tax=Vibrio vulnificus TaxID=672 RepID=UPI00102C0E10|nr:chromosome partitioning protein ParA [Vibrio vulnificus]EIV8493599.1 chromosome partitioning protein ParA [Vibrio vulnificus]EJN6709489.1 chromosome partitioning protein ParA [Vibrio vulnificus]EJN6713723.1 chromosome partitioning protein ParA [Vibrio vulnificus]ELG4947833.1 chromosome partitioning protein ParA [Vibrio vulnificus]ELG4952199.1 chromosome partitioning protein ParA [Vibrio vulnificus]
MMRTIILVFVITLSALAAGRGFITLFSGNESNVAISAQRVEATSSQSVDTIDHQPPDTMVATNVNSVSARKQTDNTSSSELLAESLHQAQGRELIAELDAFWRECQPEKQCEEQLMAVSPYLSAELFALLSQYPELNAQWQRQLGDLQFDEQQALSARIEQLKAQAREIWGELADILFADEFALYDFSLDSESLSQSEPEEFVANFQRLMVQWQNRAQSFGLVSDSAKYERGVSLIPTHFSDAEQSTIRQILEQTYLSKEERANLQTRKQTVAKQQQQVQDYQAALAELQSRLNKQRATSHAEWPESDWQNYYQQQVSEFRRTFFSS